MPCNLDPVDRCCWLRRDRAAFLAAALWLAAAGLGCERASSAALQPSEEALAAPHPFDERGGPAAPSTAGAAPSESASGLPVVRGLAFTVSDLDASLELLEALGFVVVDERYRMGPAFAAFVGVGGAEARVARLRLGGESVELTEFVTARGRRIPAEQRSNDAIFQHLAIVVRDMDRAFERVRQLPGIELTSPAPQTIPPSNPAAGGIRALYFRDADQHDLELLWFPPGKGRARWHARRDGLFLGIDHSAIAVTSTERSAPLYEALGLQVAGHSLNFGPEQAALSGVPRARVQITGWSAAAGPGVEFLSYLEPGPGAPAPADSAPNDLWHWEVELQVADLEDALRTLSEHGGQAGSSVDVSTLDLGYSRAALARDHDGHYLRLLER